MGGVDVDVDGMDVVSMVSSSSGLGGGENSDELLSEEESLMVSYSVASVLVVDSFLGGSCRRFSFLRLIAPFVILTPTRDGGFRKEALDGIPARFDGESWDLPGLLPSLAAMFVLRSCWTVFGSSVACRGLSCWSSPAGILTWSLAGLMLMTKQSLSEHLILR